MGRMKKSTTRLITVATIMHRKGKKKKIESKRHEEEENVHLQRGHHLWAAATFFFSLTLLDIKVKNTKISQSGFNLFCRTGDSFLHKTPCVKMCQQKIIQGTC